MEDSTCTPFCQFIESRAANFIGLGCCLLVVFVIWMQLKAHLTHYSVPKLQRYAIRVVMIIPVYCVNSFFAVFFQDYAFYFDVLKEVYEGFVVYNFLSLCLASVGYESDLVNWWTGHNSQLEASWFWSTCCFGNIPLNAKFLRRCKQGVLQFVVVKCCAAVFIFCSHLGGIYESGNFDAKNAYVYVFILYNFSYTIALYSLLLFYLAAKGLLTPFRPVMKFIMVKSIIFVTFWQSIVIAAMMSYGFIGASPTLTTSEFQARISNFLLVVECVPACILNYIYFAPSDFHGDLAVNFVLPTTDVCKSLAHLISVQDVWLDLKHSFSTNYSSYTLNRSETMADSVHAFEPKSMENFDPHELDNIEQNRLDADADLELQSSVTDAIEVDIHEAYDMTPIQNNSFALFTSKNRK